MPAEDPPPIWFWKRPREGALESLEPKMALMAEESLADFCLPTSRTGASYTAQHNAGESMKGTGLGLGQGTGRTDELCLPICCC